MPAEWEPHEATWLAWPHEKRDWPGKFAPIPWVYGEIVKHLHTGEFVHILVNVGMTLSLMPITGIPLPFFSYGGSFMLASWLAVGILVRISAEGRGGRTGPFAI